MRSNDSASLRSLLEQMSTEELDAMLNTELDKGTPDAGSVRLILSVLWERERDLPVEITPEIRQAWEKCQQNIADFREEELRKKQKRKTLLFRGLSMVAVAMLVLTLIIPQRAAAKNLWERIVSWTEDILTFENPDAETMPKETYVFETDNPGLQQVYDAVVEMGVTEPVVPMWLPGNSEISECRTVSTPAKDYVSAVFYGEVGDIVYNLNIYHLTMSHEYDKDITHVKNFEMYGTTYNVMRNNEVWVIIWTKDNIECSLFLDCQEDVLERILKSIYVTEENN